MATVVLLTRDPRLRARVHGALSRHHRVLDLSRWTALPGTLRLRSAHVLAFAEGEGGESTDAALGWLRRNHPALGLLVYVHLLARSREAWHLGHRGADGLVVAGVNDDRPALRRAVDDVLSRALARRVSRGLTGRIDPLVVRSVARATEGATRDTTPDDLAEAEGVGVRSLGRTLRERGLTPPGRILRWGGHFHAAAALERDDATVEDIALALGYSAGPALGRALRRDVGHSPTTLRERGALACAIDAFVAREGGAGGPGLVVR